MTASPRIPTTPDELTTTWVNAMLRHVGHNCSVQSVDVTPIGTGQMASSLRVAITYQGQSAVEAAPTSLVVKMASLDPNSRAAGARGAYLKEVRYYQQLDTALPVATPASIWSDINVETNDFALVLEDMHPATQGDQITGCDVAQVLQAATNIAGLHAPRWGDDTLYETDWLTAPLDQRSASHAELKTIMEMVTPGFINRYRSRIDERQIELLEWFATNVDSWLEDDGGVFGLTHGDHRLDNLLFNPADGDRPVTVVDWQTVAVRNPVADISYLAGTSLEPEIRRLSERDIVRSYHQQLRELGVCDYSEDDCFDDYRRQAPHVLLLTVLGSMLTVQTDRGDDMFMAMLRRGSDQIFDLR